MKRRYPEKHNVLLVNITRLGDMLQATPTISGIKRENPHCRISVVVEKQFAEVCQWIPDIDEVISLDLTYVVKCLHRDGEGVLEAYRYFHDFIEDLRARKFDFSLNMASSSYTALILSLVGTPRMGGWTADEEGCRRIESDWARLFASSVFHQNRHFTSLNLVDVFRLSADVIDHPLNLMLQVSEEAKRRAQELIEECGFTSKGPLIAIQAGASQAKRQWRTEHFVSLIKKLVADTGARVILTGTKSELSIIDPIVSALDGCFGDGRIEVGVVAGKTSIPELAGVLQASDILITGDTGPMHIAVAVGTPVVAMFVASALGYETGPYGEGSVVVQATIGCGPCHPGKPCSTIECHDLISPNLIAELAQLRLRGPLSEIPRELSNPTAYRVFGTGFDRHGVWKLEPLDPFDRDPASPYREAYRRLWLEDLGGFVAGCTAKKGGMLQKRVGERGDPVAGLAELEELGGRGIDLLDRLLEAEGDLQVSTEKLREIADSMDRTDREIEQLGYHYAYLGLLVRMFVFAKENLQGYDVKDLSSQMRGVYEDLRRRSGLLGRYIHEELKG